MRKRLWHISSPSKWEHTTASLHALSTGHNEELTIHHLGNYLHKQCLGLSSSNVLIMPVAHDVMCMMCRAEHFVSGVCSNPNPSLGNSDSAVCLCKPCDWSFPRSHRKWTPCALPTTVICAASSWLKTPSWKWSTQRCASSAFPIR